MPNGNLGFFLHISKIEAWYFQLFWRHFLTKKMWLWFWDFNLRIVKREGIKPFYNAVVSLGFKFEFELGKGAGWQGQEWGYDLSQHIWSHAHEQLFLRVWVWNLSFGNRRYAVIHDPFCPSNLYASLSANFTFLNFVFIFMVQC